MAVAPAFAVQGQVFLLKTAGSDPGTSANIATFTSQTGGAVLRIHDTDLDTQIKRVLVGVVDAQTFAEQREYAQSGVLTS